MEGKVHDSRDVDWPQCSASLPNDALAQKLRKLSLIDHGPWGGSCQSSGGWVGVVPYGHDNREDRTPKPNPEEPGADPVPATACAIEVPKRKVWHNTPNWSRVLVRGLGFIHISVRPNKPRPSAATLARSDGRVLVSRLRVRVRVTALVSTRMLHFGRTSG